MGKIPFLLNMEKYVTNSWVTKALNHRLLTDDFLSHRYITFILYFKKKHTFENKGRVLSERTMKGPIALTVFCQ